MPPHLYEMFQVDQGGPVGISVQMLKLCSDLQPDSLIYISPWDPMELQVSDLGVRGETEPRIV